MTGYYFSFGPNGSYALSTPTRTKSHGLPAKLGELVFGDTEARGRVLCLGPEGEYFYRRTTNQKTDTWNIHRVGRGDYIVDWLNKRTESGDKKIFVNYGEGKSWVGCTSNGAAAWGGLPESFEEHILGFHPVKAALGVHGSYVLINKDGRSKWNLKGKYGALGQILKNATIGIEMIALNPYNEHNFIVLFKNKTRRSDLPTSYGESVTSAIDG